MTKQQILVVDDDPNNILALVAVLKARGQSTVTATSVEEGMQVLQNNPAVGIVLLDMMMPGIDGYEMLNLIRKEETMKALPVIAVTAQAMKGDREKCLDAGATDYISKPIDVDKLVTLLREHTKTN